MNKNSPSLEKSEWALFLAILIVIGSLLIISKLTSYKHLESIDRLAVSKHVPNLSVELSGCIQRPGACQIPQGSTIRMLIRKARPRPLANLDNILLDGERIESLDRILEISCCVHVPELEKISIEIRGAVEQNVSLCLPAGSRICDLKKIVALHPDADLAFLKRRRLLKNNEVIVIPRHRNEGASEGLND